MRSSCASSDEDTYHICSRPVFALKRWQTTARCYLSSTVHVLNSTTNLPKRMLYRKNKLQSEARLLQAKYDAKQKAKDPRKAIPKYKTELETYKQNIAAKVIVYNLQKLSLAHNACRMTSTVTTWYAKPQTVRIIASLCAKEDRPWICSHSTTDHRVNMYTL